MICVLIAGLVFLSILHFVGWFRYNLSIKLMESLKVRVNVQQKYIKSLEELFESLQKDIVEQNKNNMENAKSDSEILIDIEKVVFPDSRFN